MAFLALTPPDVFSPSLEVPVVSIREEELSWIGEEGRSLAGTQLSTLRDPRRVFHCTVEFPTTALYEEFRTFITTPPDLLTGRFAAIKPMRMHLNRQGVPILSLNVTLKLGTAEGYEYRGIPFLGGPVTYIHGWTVDLTMTEI